MERLAFIPVIFLLLTLLAGCGDDDETAPMINEVAYTAADYHFIGPQLLPSGMTKLTLARQGKVMLLDDEDQEDEEDRYEAPTAPGECPYGDCPEPRSPIWEFVCTGPPNGCEPERDNRTGRYRLHPEGLAPPSAVT